MYQRFFIAMAIAGRQHLKSRPPAAARRLFAGCTTNSNNTNRLPFTAAAGSSSLPPAAARPRKSSDTREEKFSRKPTSLANFAVHTQNHRENMNFQLVRIVEVNTILVAGMRYDLTLELRTPGTSDPRRYCASVWEKLDGKIVLWDWETMDEIGFSPKITDLANFAVNTPNRFGNAHLRFLEVLHATCSEVISGMSYNILVELDDGYGKKSLYLAEVLREGDGKKYLLEWHAYM